MKRRDFLKSAALGAAGTWAGCVSTDPSGPLELEEASVQQLREALASGRETAVSLAESYLRRIDQLDRRGPAVNSVIELNPDALEIARTLDREKKARGPLHGIPVLLKDNIDTHDRMATTAGSLALEGSVPAQDAFVARKLREAGAVILGKTNLSEWANFRSSRSTSGWSGRGGLTRNPYALDRNPSGSSSGSAAAVSAGLGAVSVGTETDGSIVSPASACGIVGVKPTVGLVSRSGIIPISHSQDTAGPMARTVADAAILLGAMAGVDPRDPVTESGRGKAANDYTAFLDPNGLRGARIGVARKFFQARAPAEKGLEAALEAMKGAGAVLVDPADLPTHATYGSSEMEVLLYEFKAGLNAYLAGLGPKAPVKSLQEVIEFNERNRDREMPWFGQETFLRAQEKGPLTDKAYQEALEKGRRLSRQEGIDAVMDANRLDALVAPTGGPAAKTDFIHGNRGVGGSSSAAAVSGYPSVTVPAGDLFGLPFGISFFGRAWSEPVLLKLAYAFERVTKARRTPRFLPSIG